MFKKEVINSTNQLNSGASSYRIGLAQYGQDVTVEFLLNAFQTKEEIQDAIGRFRPNRPPPSQPRNLGNALKYTRNHMFNSKVGGRAEQGSRQFLVVVSAKASNDPVSTEARLLRSDGVTVISMSAGAPMNAIELLSDQYAYNTIKISLLTDLFRSEKKENITNGEKVFKLSNLFDQLLWNKLNNISGL